jgi:hypothetical protein
MPKEPAVPGLSVEKHHSGTGWVIIHEQSRTSFGLWLRLRRHAAAAAAEFAATGEDFTLTRDELQQNALQRRREALAAGTVLGRWNARQRYCCDGGEHYDPHTYAMNGRCIGPVSKGEPRRS